MIKNISLYLFYAILSSYGLYKIKLSGMSFNMNLIVGGSFYVIGFLIWLFILKINPLSIAFPLAAGSLIIATQVFGFIFLNEGMSSSKIVGVILIIFGIVLIFNNLKIK